MAWTIDGKTDEKKERHLSLAHSQPTVQTIERDSKKKGLPKKTLAIIIICDMVAVGVAAYICIQKFVVPSQQQSQPTPQATGQPAPTR